MWSSIMKLGHKAGSPSFKYLHIKRDWNDKSGMIHFDKSSSLHFDLYPLADKIQ